MVLMPLLSRLLTLLVILTMPLFLARLTLKQMLRDFIGIRVNRAKKSGMVNITSSVNATPLPTVNTTGYIDHAAFIGIRVNRAKKSGMVNITSSVNSRERSGINTILHELDRKSVV